MNESIKNLLTSGQIAIYFGGNGDGYAVDEVSFNSILCNFDVEIV